jgi:quinol monooxygenase YgiN
MVILKIATTIHVDKMVEFEQAVDYILQSDKTSRESIYRGMYRDWQRNNALMYLEEWKTNEELQKHISSDLFKSLLGAMKVLGDVTSAEIISSQSVQQLENI